MTPPKIRSARRTPNWAAFLLAVPFAPATAFLIWSAWAGTVRTGQLHELAFSPFVLVLATLWGLGPAAVFGAPVAWCLERWRGTGGGSAILAGAFAAALYCAASVLLVGTGLEGTGVIAPWVASSTAAHADALQQVAIIVAIILGGAIAGAVYAGTDDR